VPPLPDWSQTGAIIGMQGGTAAVRSTLDELRGAGVPVAAFWLQDWVGQRQTSFGWQLWWNWVLDRTHYPGWEDLVGELNADGIRVLTYINSFLADASENPNASRNLFREASDLGLLVRHDDGSDYLIENTSFSAGLLDLTNPAARTWIKQVIKNEVLAAGAAGWMADFGEALPFDAELHSGIPAAEYHNEYAVEWAALNREAVTEAGRHDVLFFSRSAFTTSPGATRLFWLGDQLVSWDDRDGIKTAVTGLLSSGLSGFSLNHSDTGGYTTITHLLMDYHRSKELFQRWAELNAFTAILRTHEGNRPADNHQVNSDADTLSHFARCARMYVALADYRRELMNEAAERGYPLVRPLFFHYPQDEATHDLRHQFLLGPDLLVAPVLDKGKDRVDVYVPAGTWEHVWTGEQFGSGWHNVSAPIGSPAVFVRAGSASGVELAAALRAI